jgi:hypothetical protein
MIQVNPFTCDSYPVIHHYTFTDSKCYRDGFYFGKVVYSDNDTIQVECDTDNYFMKGKIITIKKVTYETQKANQDNSK